MTHEVKIKPPVILIFFLFQTVLNPERLSRQNSTLAWLLHAVFWWHQVCDSLKVTSAWFQMEWRAGCSQPGKTYGLENTMGRSQWVALQTPSHSPCTELSSCKLCPCFPHLSAISSSCCDFLPWRSSQSSKEMGHEQVCKDRGASAGTCGPTWCWAQLSGSAPKVLCIILCFVKTKAAMVAVVKIVFIDTRSRQKIWLYLWKLIFSAFQAPVWLGRCIRQNLV